MTAYWIGIVIFSVFALHFRPLSLNEREGMYFVKLKITQYFAIVFLTLLIGLRFEVGGDWDVYAEHFERISSTPWAIIFVQKEIGHFFVNKMIASIGLSVSYVNIIYGFVFSLGLISFSRTQPRPWLVVVLAFPYLVTVVAMGYSRQATAIGLFFLGFVQLRKNNVLKYNLYIFLAMSFHITSVILLPLSFFALERKKIVNLFFGLIILIVFISYYQNMFLHLRYIYIVEVLTKSDGAFVRTVMNFFPALLLLIFHKRFKLNKIEKRIWVFFSLLILALTLLLLLTPFSTVVDRLSLYLLPVQLVVFSHLPNIFKTSDQRKIYFTLLITLYSYLIQFTWLNFASHAYLWLPYKMKLL